MIIGAADADHRTGMCVRSRSTRGAGSHPARVQGPAGPKIYAFYMRRPRIATPFIYGTSYSARRRFHESAPMDLVYLLFLFVLSAAVLGFLLVCDRLGPRK